MNMPSSPRGCIRRFAFEDRADDRIAKAFAPQRAWYDAARKDASWSRRGSGENGGAGGSGGNAGGEVRSDAASEGAALAFAIVRNVLPAALPAAAPAATHEEDRSRGEACLRALFALGEAHAAVSGSLGVAATGIALEVFDRCLREGVPPLIEDAAWRLLARLLHAPGNDALLESARASFLARALFLARAHGLDPWCREAALGALAALDPASFRASLDALVREPRSGTEFFLRARLASDVVPTLCDDETAARLFDLLTRDPSETVRLVVARTLPPDSAFFERLALKDPSDRVRAVAIARLAAPDLCRSEEGFARYFSLATKLARVELEPYVLRALVGGVRKAIARTVLSSEIAPGREALWAFLAESARTGDLAALFQVLSRHTRVKAAIAREAHLARHAVWCVELPARARGARSLVAFVRRIPAGGRKRLPKPISAPFASVEDVARVLALVAADDHGFDVEPASDGRHVIARGHAFGFRAWRFLHEMRTPSSDKRQAFPHTVGRLFEGRVHVPSQILCELAQTQVPGEPLYLPDEDGWRPAVPLPDEFVSLVFRSKPLTIVVPEGRTVVAPPHGLAARVAAWWGLTSGFAAFAQARNWTEGSQAPACEYVEKARALGFEVRFEPDDPATPSSLVRFFRSGSGASGAGLEAAARLVGTGATARGLADPATTMAGVASVHATWGAFQRFVANSNTNTLGELLLFVTALVIFFAGSHFWRHLRFRRARAALPLVIGGWGTRGKSGTERLKAALFSSMGFGIVSKTTGCEAQLLVSAPFGALKEVPLYRPYDKATIWEQQNVVEFASAFGVNVFLWECMGLTPDYVGILQRSWMRDDLSTLTNTYPDHEDLQGPAGINIPQVMTHFIPEGSALCTTEEQMLPLLIEAASSRGTTVRAAGWHEAGRIPLEILSLFPYEEHPYNVALVLEVADACGVDSLFALRAMAEKVVPDIGVLKTYPTVEGRGRSFSFSNGCSANERHGAQSNWTRLAFDTPQSRRAAGSWLCAYVNNRADRVARSQVFARMMVRDLSVDRFFLVGTNLAGLAGFVRAELALYLDEVDLWREGEASPEAGAQGSSRSHGVDPGARLVALFEHFRLAHDEGLVQSELSVMARCFGVKDSALAAVVERWSDPAGLKALLVGEGLAEGDLAEILFFHEGRLAQWEGFYGFRRGVEALQALGARSAGAETRRVNQALRDFLREAFLAKIVSLEETVQEDGDAMAEALLAATPPGFHQRVMGIQNIKGPGLTLIYRLEIWGDLVRQIAFAHEAGSRLRLREILKRMEAHRDVPTFARNVVARQLATLANGEAVGQEERALIDGLLARCDARPLGTFGGSLAVRAPNPGQAVETRGPALRSALRILTHPVLEFFEPLAAVIRRRRADRIYRQLAEGGVSPSEAAEELRVLTAES